MKTLYITFLTLGLLVTSAEAQNSKQDGKNQKKNAQYQLVKEVVASKEYQFIGRYAMPQKGSQVDLSSRANSLKITDNKGLGDLSYFGALQNAGHLSGEAGIKFDAQFEEYNVTSNDKKYRVVITFKIKGDGEIFNCTIEAGSLESASLSISSNQRQSIRYTGTLAGN